MSKLKEMKLLEGKDLSKVKFPGVIRHEHIYNDYHERVTNPGFSRNYQGKFYTKWKWLGSIHHFYHIYKLLIIDRVRAIWLKDGGKLVNNLTMTLERNWRNKDAGMRGDCWSSVRIAIRVQVVSVGLSKNNLTNVQDF